MNIASTALPTTAHSQSPAHHHARREAPPSSARSHTSRQARPGEEGASR